MQKPNSAPGPEGRLRIGEFLVEKGVLTRQDVETILRYARTSGLRFGEAGIEMGLIKREALIRVFGPSYKTDFFHLNPAYFPQVTKDLFPVDVILRHGVLPLAHKTERRFIFGTRKRLNVGMLDPASKEALAAVEKLTAGQFDGIKIFLVLADQFLEVVRQVYGVSPDQLRRKGADELSDRLQMFLEHVPELR